MGLFFSRIISLLFLSLIIIIISGFWLFFPIGYIILIYKSFISAVTIGFLIILYGLSGILLSLFVLIPVLIISHIALLALVCICSKRSLTCKKYGTPFFSDNPPYFPFRSTYFVFAIILLSCLWELLFLPVFSMSFIIIY